MTMSSHLHALPDGCQVPAEEIQARLKQCRWPDLAEPYRQALRDAVTFILGHVPDLLGILVSGTIIRGTPAASSDLDIYVVRSEPERQRIQRWFNGIPTEIFINPPHQVRRYLSEEHAAGRPITAHMIATGFTVIATDSVLAELRALAVETYAAPPALSAEQMTTARYMAATRLEDALDMLDARPETAKMILTLAVYDMLHYRFLAANRFRPRDKDLLEALTTLDAGLASSARAFFGQPSLDQAVDLARDIADRTIKTYGFFEWASTPQRVAPPDDGEVPEKSSA